MLLWLEFRAYLGAPRRLGDSSAVVARGLDIRMFSAGIARKHEEKRVLENAQIEAPG